MIRSRSQRLPNAPHSRPPAEPLDPSAFMLELVKEIDRSDRRRRDKEFGLVCLVFRESDPESFVATPTFDKCRQRLRLSDSCGWYDGNLTFLLPETDRDGALTVANAVTRICVDDGIAIDTEVSVYPQDDDLIAASDEIRSAPLDEDPQKELPFDKIDPPADLLTDNGSGELREDYGHGGLSGPHSSLAVKAPKQAKLVRSTPQGQPVLFHHRLGTVVETKRRFIPAVKTPWWKRTIDVVGAMAGLVLLSPVLLAAAAAIKLTSRGPVFFRQKREGKDGRVFEILKFRTMDVDAESLQNQLREKSEQDGPAFKLTNDPRVTSIGKYLRKSCIDELPQLINILTGDMSLVGPRPLPVSESQACTAWQRARLSVLPGLTCTWQAYGGRNVKFDQWMRMDLDYIQRRGFWFDLKLITDTAFIALMHRGSV